MTREPYDFILETIERAGNRLLELRDQGFTTEGKGGDSKDTVTTVDREIDAFLTMSVQAAFPDHAIYSEEGTGVRNTSPYQWVIDPIDGSSNFSRGIPHYAVCLGLLENGIPIVGAVYNPVTKELFSFKKGEGAFLNGRPISVLPTQNLNEAFILFHAGRRGDLQTWGGESYRRLLQAARKTGNLSSTALDTCFVAAGRVEASVYGTYSTLDVAAAIGILKEAGGVVADADGNDPALSSDAQRIFVANNPSILDALRTCLES